VPLYSGQVIAGVNEDARGAVVQVVVECVGVLNIYVRRDCAEPPCAEHSERVVVTVMAKDAHTVALSHAERRECPRHAFCLCG
jgi:hypothetical protein